MGLDTFVWDGFAVILEFGVLVELLSPVGY